MVASYAVYQYVFIQHACTLNSVAGRTETIIRIVRVFACVSWYSNTKKVIRYTYNEDFSAVILAYFATNF